MSFTFPTILQYGWPLIALPLLIHLINLRRHRRVQWAAMDFLLESQKRNKKWILLRQLMLMLMRTAAIALLLGMLAGPELKFQWGQLFGQGTTHHYVLLDDSYSMSDRKGSRTAFADAKGVLTKLLDQATRQPGNQKLTMLKFSEAANLTLGAESDQLEQSLSRGNYEQIAAKIAQLTVAESDAGPVETVRASLGLPEPADTESRIIYMISDFRAQQWRNNPELAQLLDELRADADQLHFIQCVDVTRPNLAITELAPESGLRAAGVETWMQLTVANYGDYAATDVTASITQDGQKLPAIRFDSIPPSSTVTRRFRVTYPTAGAHQLQAKLDSDAIELDNTFYFACDVPLEYPVLLVDGSRQGDDSFYLRTALNPGGSSRAGWSPQVERPEVLRQHESLGDYSAICLLDVARLDGPEVDALENYVNRGGGLGIFVGPNVQKAFYNERLYKDGQGLMPVPLSVPTQLLTTGAENVPDLTVSDHPVFRIFSGERNSFLSIVAVNYYYALPADWSFPRDGSVSILASLRNKAPFVAEKRFGAGRVLLQLSKLSPKSNDLGSWTNWSLNPAFPVFANELIGYLSAKTRQLKPRVVGSSLALRVRQEDYEPEARLLQPRTNSAGSNVETVIPKVEDGNFVIEAGQCDRSGVWEIELRPRDGAVEQRLFAVNVPPSEGDLHHLGREGLAQQLPDLDYVYSLASQMSAQGSSFAGYALGDTFLYVLLATLVLEQWFAYRTSYHATAKPPA